MKIDPADIHLDAKQQRELAELSERSGRPWPDVLSEALSGYRSTHADKPDGGSEESFYDAASRLGLIGCIEGCPSDLSSNPRYMAGFGSSGSRTSAG
jgi:hypothetical protein